MSPLSVFCFGIVISLVVFDSTNAAPQPQHGGGFGGGSFGRPDYGRPGYGHSVGGFGREREGFGREREGFGREREGFGRSNGPNISISKSVSISGGRGGSGGAAISSAQSRASGK